jgi:hypothetical protein
MTHPTFGSTPVGAAGVGAGLLDLLVRRRGSILAGYVVGSVVVGAALGSVDRPTVLWFLIGLVALAGAGTERGIRRVLMDWLPVLVIAAGYDTVRAQAPELLTRAVVKPQLRFDEIAFGGTAPTVSLQRALGVRAGHVHWWDYLAWLFYLSHFVVTLSVAAVLYFRDRPRFRRLAAVVLTVSVAGFVTYFIVPAVPPWLASRQGALAHTTRVVHDVWAHLGLPGVAKVFNGDAQLANPVAALPSLHAAWPLLVLLVLWPAVGRRGRAALVAYNLVLCTVLVYGAEHYVSDILLGWVYAVAGFLLWQRIWARRAAGPEVTPAAAHRSR